MATPYRGYTLNDAAEPADWSPREIALFKDIIDKLPEETETLVTTEHVHSKLVANDGDPDPALRCDDDGHVIIGSGLASTDALAHIYGGDTGGTVIPGATLVLEETGSEVMLQLLTDDNLYSKIYFGSLSDVDAGYILYKYDDATMTFGVDGVTIMKLVEGAQDYLQMQTGAYVKLGHDAACDTSGIDRAIYGPSNLSCYIPLVDKSGTVWWVPGTSTQPS